MYHAMIGLDMQENIAYNKITAAANVSMQALANQTHDSQSEVETTTHITVTSPSQEFQRQPTQHKAGAFPVETGTMTTTDNHLYAVLEEQCTHPHDNDTITNEGHVYAVLEDTSTRSMDSHQHND